MRVAGARRHGTPRSVHLRRVAAERGWQQNMTKGEGAGRTVAIPGAGRRLGRSVALKLAEKGYRVHGTGLLDAEVDKLRDASSGRVSLSVTDIADELAVRTWATRVSDEIGPAGLNALASNASIRTPGPLQVLPLRAVNVNSTSTCSAASV